MYSHVFTNPINVNMSNIRKSGVPGLNTELNALRQDSQGGQVRGSNFYLYSPFGTGPLMQDGKSLSLLLHGLPHPEWKWSQVGFGDHSLKTGVLETVLLLVAGADWRPPHLCAGWWPTMRSS